MNEQQQLIKDTLDRLLTDLCTKEVVDAAEAGTWAAGLWGALTETGLTLAGIPEENGGSGGDQADSLLVIREAARFGAPVPLAEHFIAATLLAETGAMAATLPMTIAEGSFSLDAAGRLVGEAASVPFASWCNEMVLVADSDEGHRLCRVPLAGCTLDQGRNLAGEPRNAVSIDVQLQDDQIFPATADTAWRMHLMGAATRGLMMSGALESILEMSVQYSLERSQFGRPISKFQAIQQQLATLAGEVAASTMAGHSIVDAFAGLDEIDIAIAKARIGESVSISTDIAHQVHGAMGYTMEHSLNLRTRRLWSWRDEFGSEPEWQQRVGRAFLQGGADGLWAAITARR